MNRPTTTQAAEMAADIAVALRVPAYEANQILLQTLRGNAPERHADALAPLVLKWKEGEK